MPAQEQTGFVNADAVLKDWYDDGKIEPQVITESVLLKKVEATDRDIVVDNVGGRQVVFPVRRGLTQGLGARGRSEPNPKARKQLLDKCNFPMKKLVARVQIEGEAWRATLGAGKKAFISLIAEETNQALMGFTKDMNWQLYSDGTGLRGTVTTGSAAGADVDVIVDDIRGFYEDMLLDLYTAAGVLKKADLVVTSVDVDTKTISIEDTDGSAIVAGEKFYRAGNKDREVMGFKGMINDTSGVATFQGLTVADKGYWRSLILRNGGTDRPLSTNLMERAWLNSMKQDRLPADLILLDFDQHRAYSELLVTDKRFAEGSGRPILDGGYKRLAYNGVALETDVDHPAKQITFAKSRYLRLYRQTGFIWKQSPDMTAIWKQVEGYDAYEATAYWEGEFATKRRNAHDRIEELEVPS